MFTEVKIHIHIGLFNNHSQFIEKVNQQGSNFFIIISLLFMTFNMIFNDLFSQKTTKDI